MIFTLNLRSFDKKGIDLIVVYLFLLMVLMPLLHIFMYINQIVNYFLKSRLQFHFFAKNEFGLFICL